MKIYPKVERLVPEMIKWRREFHAHPETAFEEKETSERVASLLNRFGLEIQRGLGKTGLVGILSKGGRSGRSSRAIGLRADMDALDIREENAFEYRSRKEGKMHACGHDGHMAMLLGAARYLEEEGDFEGTVYFIFQPAEENEGGGKTMVEDGLFDKFDMDAVFGLHNTPGLSLGSFAIRPGPMMAGFDIFDITVEGTGGHAAMPHLGGDSLLASSYMISMLQTIVSRNIDPIEPAVVSVTRLNAGTAYNILPERVDIRGTARYFSPQVQDLIEARMKKIVEGVAGSMGVRATLRYERRYPPVVNTKAETETAIRAASLVAGEKAVNGNMPAMLGSEDFSFMLSKRPGAYICLGSGERRQGGMLHQSRYDFNEELLPIGASYWVKLVELLLG